jgi:hypothetical protein
VTGSRTSKAITARRHLLCCPKRLTGGPRAPTPEGSQPACARGDVATPIRPVTDRPSLAPSSSTRCPLRSSYDSPCCPKAAGQRAYHVPQVERTGWFRPRLFAGGAASAPGKFGAPGPDHVPFGPSLILKPPCGWRARHQPFFSSTFGLSFVTTFNDASPGLAMPPHPRPRPL